MDDLLQALRSGDRTALARAITLIESTAASDRTLGDALLRAAHNVAPTGTLRVGITGIPGAGKSTLIDSLGPLWTQAGHQVAVLAVDPSGGTSGGSILGDKTRMARLSVDPRAFIRPSPSSGVLGGVAGRTREAMVLCEAAGYDRVLIETVGIGQSEVAVEHLVDVNVLVTVAGTGDELQGIKRGVMGSADLVVLNKADGPNRSRSEQARSDLRAAIALLPPRPTGERSVVLLCSAMEGTGVAELHVAIEQLAAKASASGTLNARRVEQAVQWFRSSLEREVLRAFNEDARMADRKRELEAAVREGKLDATQAAAELVAMFFKDRER